MRRLGQINHCWEANFSVPSSWTILRRLELNQVFSEGEIYRPVSVQHYTVYSLTVRRSLASWVSHETQNITGSANSNHHPQPWSLPGPGLHQDCHRHDHWCWSSPCHLVISGQQRRRLRWCWFDWSLCGAITSHHQPLPYTEDCLAGLQPAARLCLPNWQPPLAGTA